MDIGKIIQVEITTELSKSYLDYAMSVIVARALPDVRDGLKPVHRRILFAMHQMGMGPGAPYRKSATVVGEVLGKYHPHGDVPVYEAAVRLAQDFSMRYPLVDGQGNYGSVDGDPPAAMRYTEMRLAKIAESMLMDIDKQTVDYTDNFDATLKEPSYLPALLPNLLLMGSEGIAVGMATKIPPHNLKEVVAAAIDTIKKGKAVIEQTKVDEEADYFIGKIDKIAAGTGEDLTEEDLHKLSATFESEITLQELVNHVPGPDFPTGGAIYDANSLIDVYATGRGRIVVRGIAEIKDGKKGRTIIEITELPYQVNKAVLVANIADLVRDKKIVGIAALRDESDKAGMSVVIELKRDAKPKSVLNNLYKHTKLQSTFPANFVALVDGTPQTVNLKTVITEYVKHRQRVILRRTIFELTSAKKRAHILEGLKIALDHLDEVIATIRASRTQDEAKTNLIAKFGFSEIQATAILDMQLRRLAALEREKIEAEYKEIMETVDRLIAILKDPQKPLSIIVEELGILLEKYVDKRRTRIFKSKLGEFSEEDLTPKEDTLITVTKTGYIKRVPKSTYKAQGRGGKGVIGMTTKDEDEIKFLVSATTHDQLLFFTNRGRVFGAKAWEIPESGRTAKGQALVNIINLESGEEIMSILPLDKTEVKHLIMATAQGVVKKSALSEFENLRSNGLIAIKLAAGDALVRVRPTTGKDDVLMLTRNGQSIRFAEGDVRPMGRATTGVRGINLVGDDAVIGLEVFASTTKGTHTVLTVSENGLGKQSKIELFPLQKRGGKGVRAVVVGTKTGKLASAIMVLEKETDQIIMTSKFGQVINMSLKDIPHMGRSTQGVILMRFADKTDHIAAVTAVMGTPELAEETPKKAE